MAHRWTERDDIVALYLHKFGTDKLPWRRLADVAAQIGMEKGSLRMRVGNFKALSGEGGLRNFARQSERVFHEYGDFDERELRFAAFPLLRERS